MKKNLLAAIAFLFAMPLFSNAQTWSGSTPGNIYYNSGNVGIGTSSPGQKLVVVGNANVGGQIRADLGSTGQSLVLTGSGSNFQISHNGSTNIQAFNSSGGAIQFNNYANSSTFLHLGGSGNVGIGTTTPASLLNLAGAEYAPATSGSAQNSTFRVGATSTNLALDAGVATSGAVPYSWLQSRNQATYAANYALSLNPNGGNVGIGTTTPDKLLSVNGTIHSKEVLIDLTGWSDYVLKPAYKLPALSFVKTYIEQNQHLPDVPTEVEMVKNGLSVSEMNKLLMKKVEEITLYLIQQKEEKDKQIAELNQQIAELKNKIH